VPSLAGLVLEGRVLDLATLAADADADAAAHRPPHAGVDAGSLAGWLELCRRLDPARLARIEGIPLEQVALAPPVDPVASFRDFYAFEEHVRSARARRGLEMIPEWYEQAVFYFSNPRSIVGHGAPVTAPPYGSWLDFELEVGCVIGRGGRDITAERAEQHIAGYAVLNDWSLRDVQRQEMKVGLGPAKGKDFATSLGPLLVTPDELEDRRAGKGYDLRMTARVNGQLISDGNWKTIHFGFAELIARASQGVELYPGDLLGSGTVGTGCILELGPERAGGWLKPGDVVELEVERLGALVNRVRAGGA